MTLRLKIPRSMQNHSTLHCVELAHESTGSSSSTSSISLSHRWWCSLHNNVPACCWRRGLQYLTNWKGYGPEERSWDLVHCILNRMLIADFELQQPKQVTGLPYLAGTSMSTLSFTPPELPICLVEDALWDVRSHPLGVFCHILLQLNQSNPPNQCLISALLLFCVSTMTHEPYYCETILHLT